MSISTASPKSSAKIFFNNVLAGTATGIIVGLIPNAVISAVLKLFGQSAWVLSLSHALIIFQCATPLLIGALVAYQFKLLPVDIASVAAAAYVGSGVTKFNPATKINGVYVSSGTGDLINTMITAALAVWVTLLIGSKLGSVKIVLGPIIIGGGVGWIGYLLLPYVARITTWIGDLVNSFTNFQPVVMCILISCMFALLIITPISTVAIGMAIQLNGISAGAAAMGVAATTIVLVVHSWKTNKSGVTLAVALGAMKMMIPNLFRYPIILLPVMTTAIISAIPVALFQVAGTPASAGFGLVGLVGPLASLDVGDLSINILIAALVWFIIPIIAAVASRFVYGKILYLYNEQQAFAYLGE
ncbi:PTS sugar transporter subunit IIC [Bombilactobacillus bombi]|uniref:PTS sugar transporter subunit IIC n=1 Tax=Bombilactobacillus bombi TaxID=1303590 RepID=UPI0015E60C9F|nr:PTS sugar transporter subunit IIC [Bombilactobacillus bombi]MBA1433832.1 PTS sugar transporter subunit IIC [Bombilactobacillus bombi]